MYQITDKTFLELLTDPTIELKPVYSIDGDGRVKIVELVINTLLKKDFDLPEEYQVYRKFFPF